MYRHLTIGDLHLYDREMRTTKKMVENSRVIMDEIYQYLLDNEDIILLNINGDIQHKTPSNIYNRKEVSYWRSMFRKIGELMLKRFNKFDAYKLVGVSDENKELLKKGIIYPVFTTRGNHDLDNKVSHTFYDDLIAEGLIIEARALLVRTGEQRTYFDYRNYDTESRKVPDFKKETDVIALEHDDVLHAESLLWKVPNAAKKFKRAEDLIKGVDVMILHHIHESVDPLFIGEEEKQVLWQVGSLGRTAFDDASKRDEGYGALMNFGDVENFHRVEFKLIPYQEYFNYKQILDKKSEKQDFKNFSLKVDEYEIEALSFEEDINKLTEVDDDVKKYAIEVMKEVESRGKE